MSRHQPPEHPACDDPARQDPGRDDRSGGVRSGAPGCQRPALLELEGLCISVRAGAGWRTVVDQVSLRIDQGERLGLVGESGSGKSLTALASLGLLPEAARVSRGAARVAGVSLLDQPASELRKLRGRTIALVLQEAAGALNPTYTVAFQMAETIRAHHGGGRRAARARAAESLRQLGLDDPRSVLRAYPHQLSGGQAQRVSLALALAGRPSLLVADEPVTALDVTTQAQVLRLIKDECTRRSMALLLISHDLAVVASLVTRVAVMLAGELVEVAGTEKILHHAMHPYTRSLMAASRGAGSTVGSSGRSGQDLQTAGRSLQSHAVGCRFVSLCPLRLSTCEEQHPELSAVSPGHLVRCPVVSGELPPRDRSAEHAWRQKRDHAL